MKLRVLEDTNIDKLKGEHAVIVISNGQVKITELPDYGTVVIESHNSKVKQVKEEVKQQF